MHKYRLRFKKTGRSVYISHLDLMRTMQRAFLRAALPIKYSEGFNPHALISILLPLPLGMESVCELMDFRLAQELPCGEICQRLSAALPEGIRALEVCQSEQKSKYLKWLAVEGFLEYDSGDAKQVAEDVKAFFAAPEINVTRKTKRGEGEIDLVPHLKNLQIETAKGGLSISCIVSAQEPTINPELLCSALRQSAPQLAPDFASWKRTENYCEDMVKFV